MKRDNTPWGPTPAAALEWRANGEPFSTRFEDVYFARDHGLEESRHVFLHGNDLPARWRSFTGDSFCIAETGFGTGLNFLLTWQAWDALAEPRPRLHYISIEKYPLDARQLARALRPWTELAPLAEQLFAAWPGRLRGQHRICLAGGALTLDLWWEEANAALADLASHGPLVDAWYLDGFAPSRNGEMWQPELFLDMSRLSRPQATVSTFTAAGAVRRGLQAAGFGMRKTPGYGRKRDSLAGIAETVARPAAHVETPWDLAATPASRPETALIIGAGLAGATLAHALAARGVKVTVADSAGIAGAASGNAQGILYTRLSPKHSQITDFALQSFRHASHFYRQLFASGVLAADRDGELCGSFHLHENPAELTQMHDQLQGLEDLASVVDRNQATELLGAQPAAAGYWFPASGWLNPPAVCRGLLQSPGINVLEHCGNLQLAGGSDGWKAQDVNGLTIATADVAIVCTGVASQLFTGLDWLPIQSIRGQTTLIPAVPGSEGLRAAVCHRGYISPPRLGTHCIGASFKLRDPDSGEREAEHRENIDKLIAALPRLQAELGALDIRQLSGRVGYRCASPDYLPIAGPVPDRSEFLQQFASLRKNARQLVNQRGSYMPGLYVSTAHGSRGLTSAPLCAQVLASAICHEAPPLSRELLRALSPARFLIRDLSRNRI